MGMEDRESHAAVDSVLAIERELVAGWTGDLVVREQRGRVMQLQRVPEWCDAYHLALDGMVERRWRQSIHGVASLSTTAWVEAGQPDLGRALQPEAVGLMGWWGRWRSGNREATGE